MLKLLRGFAAAVRTAWLLVGITLVFLVVAELLAGAWLRWRGPAKPAVDSRAQADGYHGAAWVADYFREFDAANHVAWHSYVYWRRKPFSGRDINIDERGIRKTWNPPTAAPSTPPRRIFIFGGSTMWGTGARDDYTIASNLSRLLATQQPAPVEVTNFAEGGYVSTQDLIALLGELQRGNVPDLAIFLDGVNDVFAAFQADTPGVPQNESNRVREFNIDIDGRIYREAATTFLHHLALYPGPRGASSTTAPPWSTHLDTLGDETVQTYISTIAIAHHLGEAYHFTTLFYWQPVIFTKQHLTPYEASEAERQAGLREFYVSVYAKAHQQLSQILDARDLGDLFAADAAPYFIDFCHLTETGNERIAQAMVADVSMALRRWH